MNIAENIINFFKSKSNPETTGPAPEGICPNCWGRQEWEGNYYELMKARNITPESNTYNSFINEVVTKLDKITLKEDSYECTTCHIKSKPAS